MEAGHGLQEPDHTIGVDPEPEATIVCGHIYEHTYGHMLPYMVIVSPDAAQRTQTNALAPLEVVSLMALTWCMTRYWMEQL